MHPDGLRPGLARPVRIDPQGLTGPTPKQARGPSFRRTSRGLYVPSTVDATTEQRIVEAEAVLPVYGGVTGWATLSWHGGVWFDGTTAGLQRPVTLATGSNDIRPQPGVALSQERLARDELVVVDGLRTTRPVRAVCFEMRYAAGLVAAVRVLDLACFNDLVSIDEVATYLQGLNGWTGVPQARDAVPLGDENCWSPPEVDLGLIWRVVAGLAPALANRPVFDLSGRHLATPDLLDPESGLAVEYDGRLHLQGQRRKRDRDRFERLHDVGIETVTVLAGDTAGRVADRMVRERERVLARRTAERRWTIDAPPWWVPTSTVAQRRALQPWQKSRCWLTGARWADRLGSDRGVPARSLTGRSVRFIAVPSAPPGVVPDSSALNFEISGPKGQGPSREGPVGPLGRRGAETSGTTPRGAAGAAGTAGTAGTAATAGTPGTPGTLGTLGTPDTAGTARHPQPNLPPRPTAPTRPRRRATRRSPRSR